ncbi:SMC-Scp complex subunit ScpB [Culicoidibacter larvae]|uniref:Segregation and condensation protein B n=1 Tax=Culicoidibacter larvae TaxID=2579976 RepID=A0A5R8Q841_9FIRM|nr:SMC-Scp complex subunit ScpB [Culicoidibacter larvae]TLG71760.1 SMC-Scp complex subunit ScpB [Culicoidibacter larvae]
MDERLAHLEGLLFICGDEGLSFEQIAAAMNATNGDTEFLLEALKEQYNNPSRGIELQRLGGVYKLTTKRDHAAFYQDFFTNTAVHTLSNATLEVLSVIAYKQPVTRADIEAVRGVGSDHIVRRLVAYGFIAEVGRQETPGRPVLYATTPEFLDYFGLQHLDELPDLGEVGREDVAEDVDIFMTKYREQMDAKEEEE